MTIKHRTQNIDGHPLAFDVGDVFGYQNVRDQDGGTVSQNNKLWFCVYSIISIV